MNISTSPTKKKKKKHANTWSTTIYFYYQREKEKKNWLIRGKVRTKNAEMRVITGERV